MNNKIQKGRIEKMRESNKMVSPFVSVILPVYNGRDYIKEAISSILKQTYKDFELIIIDDGSKDDSLKIILEIKDKRIRIYTQENMGLAATLNRGIEKARGVLIARQDQDDMSLPKRLEKQVKFMYEHQDYGLVGTWAEIIDGDRETEKVIRYSSDNRKLCTDLLFKNPFIHSSVIIRKKLLVKINGYTTDKELQPPEDYELWIRMSREAKVHNIPEVLLKHRISPFSMSKSKPNIFQKQLINICIDNLAFCTNETKTNSAIKAIAIFLHGNIKELKVKPNFELMRLILKKAVKVTANNNLTFKQKIRIYMLIMKMKLKWLLKDTIIANKMQDWSEK